MTKLSNTRYQSRRAQVMATLPKGAVVVLRAGSLCTRNSDCEYEFRPNSHFFYLTGFPESDACLIIGADGVSHLFSLPKDIEKEQWEGFRYGDNATDVFGFDKVHPLAHLDTVALSLLDGASAVVFPFEDALLNEKVMSWRSTLSKRARAGAIAPTVIRDLVPILSEMRLIKDDEEIALMEKAAQISVQAHRAAMQNVKPTMMEYQLEAELNYHFMKSGSRHLAYNNIVASGVNACTLHYINNQDEIRDGDLVLIDAGCELGCYASDITRTFPANGRFSEPQAALYQVVLDAYYAGFAKLNVGEAYESCHNAAVETITAGLIKLGLLKGELKTLIESKAYRAFYMHNTGHWLGLDVHDVGAYKIDGESRPLKAGMTLTLEPGIYVSKDNMDVAAKWRGIGIRIEDDIVITEQGPYVLTHGLPKEISEIESLVTTG
ncbi:aminopeptidase P N-terminal domain-containing protein [Marinomonas sp. 15G1-11]|uniref:Xaa-Pro aminopeptidase n=1 Tax=Marinomonas phaeophyticola TaxID=3004091 RepID=A0ABT4JUM3_9GAMM|nr:aminopeptidase P N-terminal domain-containing protein [Marinomonas sp. 15G1-11]MCZ2722106.1 aminopeptidase P N-terminal domain-containing protein [Marinomonas sp. 15G1-11]